MAGTSRQAGPIPPPGVRPSAAQASVLAVPDAVVAAVVPVLLQLDYANREFGLAGDQPNLRVFPAAGDFWISASTFDMRERNEN